MLLLVDLFETGKTRALAVAKPSLSLVAEQPAVDLLTVSDATPAGWLACGKTTNKSASRLEAVGCWELGAETDKTLCGSSRAESRAKSSPRPGARRVAAR